MNKMNKMNICPNCNKEFPLKKNGRGGYTECCSTECGHELKTKRHYEEYLADNSIAYGQQNMQNYKNGF